MELLLKRLLNPMLAVLKGRNRNKNTTSHALYKTYMGEVDSRGLPAQVHHSLKRMTVISLGIDSIVILVSLLLTRRLSKGKGSPAVIVYINFPYLPHSAMIIVI